MQEKPTQPLKPLEVSKLLGLLLRLSETGSNEVIKRLARSLQNVLSRDIIRDTIQF